MGVSSPVFVGRDEELAALGAALERAAGGRAQAVLLAGDSGVGKSRLLAEFRLSPGGSQAYWLAGDCIAVAEGDLPYAPIIAALRTVASESVDPDQIAESAPELARLMPGLGRPEAPDRAQSGDESARASVRGELAQGRMFEQVLSLLADLSAEQPVVLAVEDLHWADQSTRDLLSFLIRNTRREPVLLICSFRGDELHRRHPLRPFLAEHERLGWVEHVELRAFTQSELNAQLEGILGEPPDPELAVRLFERSEGNPFFSEELLAASSARGEQLPPTIRDALILRVEALSAPTQGVLRAAAAAGRGVTHPLLATVAGLPETELTSALREAVAHQLLTHDVERVSYAFRHALLAETVLADLLPGERIRLHLALAEALAADPGLAAQSAGDAAAELAFHWLACHKLDEAMSASIEAGRQAELSCAYAEANRHFEHALELWDRVEDAEHRAGMDHPALVLRSAGNAATAGHAQRALALARAAVGELDEDRKPMRVGLAQAMLGQCLWQAGDSEDAIAVLDRAVEMLPDDPPSVERARVLCEKARMLMTHGYPKESLLCCEEAISIAVDIGAATERAEALSTLGCALLLLGDRPAAIARISEGKRIAEELAPQVLKRAYPNLAEALEHDGRVEEAIALGLEGADVVRGLGQRTWMAYLLGGVAARLVRLGQLDRANEVVAEGMRMRIEGIDMAQLQSVAGEIHLYRGDLAHARTELERAVESAGSTSDIMIQAIVTDRRAHLEVVSGNPERAVSLIDEAVATLADREQIAHTARMYTVAVRALADRAEQARTLGDDILVSDAARSAGALVERLDRLMDPERWFGSPPPEAIANAALVNAELDRLHGESKPETWNAVAARWSERGYRLDLAYARWRQAEAMLAAAGARAAPADALREAAELAAESGAALIGAEVEALARRARIDLTDRAASSAPKPAGQEVERFGLTDRELDVLALVAEGRTNREIGEALYISTKTASAHVSHILSKLEVRSRIEAATAAHRLGLVPEKSG